MKNKKIYIILAIILGICICIKIYSGYSKQQSNAFNSLNKKISTTKECDKLNYKECIDSVNDFDKEAKSIKESKEYKKLNKTNRKKINKLIKEKSHDLKKETYEKLNNVEFFSVGDFDINKSNEVELKERKDKLNSNIDDLKDYKKEINKVKNTLTKEKFEKLNEKVDSHIKNDEKELENIDDKLSKIEKAKAEEEAKKKASENKKNNSNSSNSYNRPSYNKPSYNKPGDKLNPAGSEAYKIRKECGSFVGPIPKGKKIARNSCSYLSEHRINFGEYVYYKELYTDGTSNSWTNQEALDRYNRDIELWRNGEYHK